MCRPPFRTSTGAIPDHYSHGRRQSNGPQAPQQQSSSTAGLQDSIKQHNVPLANPKAGSNKRKRPSDYEAEQHLSLSRSKRQKFAAQGSKQVFDNVAPTLGIAYDTIMTKDAKNNRAGRVLDEAIPALRRRRTLQMSDGVLAVPVTPDSTVVHPSKNTDRQKDASPKSIPQSKHSLVPLEDSSIVPAVLIQPLQESSSASKLLTPTPTMSNPTPIVSKPQTPTLEHSMPNLEATLASPSSDTGSQVKNNKRFLSLSDIQEVIERHLRCLHDDHRYQVATELDHALAYKKPRLDSLDSNLRCAAPNGMMGVSHKKSPFDTMQPIEIKTKTKVGFPGKRYAHMELETYHAGSKSKSKGAMACPISTYDPHEPEMPSYTQGLPGYTQYVSVTRSVLGENVKQMHAWPYFKFEGTHVPEEDNVYDNLRQQYHVDIEQWPRKVQRAQEVRTYAPYVEAFLEDIGSSMSDVLYYFLEPKKDHVKFANCRPRDALCKEDFNRQSPRWVQVFSSLLKPSRDALKKAALACIAFSDALRDVTLTMWHIARKSQAAYPSDGL